MLLDLKELREKSAIRAEQGFRTYKNVPITYWTTALMGEGGELCNMIKKLERVANGGIDGGSSYTAETINKEMLAEEIGGIGIYLDILAGLLNISLEEAIITTFNSKSKKYNFQQFLSEYPEVDYILRTIDTTKWYWCKCTNCGWEDSSEFCEGGHPIADTGDHTDPECPVCGCKNIDGDPEVKWPEEHSGIHVVKIPFDIFIAPYKKAVESLMSLQFDRKYGFSNGVALIAEERERQIVKEGWSAEHDEQHDSQEILDAAICYAHAGFIGTDVDKIINRTHKWPWYPEWWKPQDNIRNLVKAGALIAAEIDRLQKSNK